MSIKSGATCKHAARQLNMPDGLMRVDYVSRLAATQHMLAYQPVII